VNAQHARIGMNVECMKHICITTYACVAFSKCSIVFEKIQFPNKCTTFVQLIQNQVYSKKHTNLVKTIALDFECSFLYYVLL